MAFGTTKPKHATVIAAELEETETRYQSAIAAHAQDVKTRQDHVEDRLASLEIEHSHLRKLANKVGL